MARDEKLKLEKVKASHTVGGAACGTAMTFCVKLWSPFTISRSTNDCPGSRNSLKIIRDSVDSGFFCSLKKLETILFHFFCLIIASVFLEP